MTLLGVDLSVLHPDDRDMVEGFRVWRMGPWRGRAERWDLMPVTDLGLSRAFVLDLMAGGIFLTGALAGALKQPESGRPEPLDRPRRRAAAGRAVAAAIAATEPERQAIAADLAELVDHLVARRAAS